MKLVFSTSPLRLLPCEMSCFHLPLSLPCIAYLDLSGNFITLNELYPMTPAPLVKTKSMGMGEGIMGEKVQLMRRIIGRYKINRGRLRIV